MERRLQSLKLPRDLTLGGTKPPKKAYAPNLNVVRNKGKSKEFLKKQEDASKVKKGGPKNKKTSNREHNNGHFVQMSGVLSEGIGSDLVKKALIKSERSYNGRDNTPVAMQIPTIQRDSWEVNMKTEENVFEDIMRSGFESDDDEKLPFTPIAWNESDLKDIRVPKLREIKSEISDDTVIKAAENNCNGTSDEPLAKRFKFQESCNTLPAEYQDSETPSDHNPVLTLWNLPVSFSAKGLSDDPNDTTVTDYKLRNMLEGQIGKISVRKSGRMEIQIGNMRYNLEPTRSSHEPVYSTEEIVMLEDTESGKVTSSVFGQIQNNFMLTPNWRHLLSSDN